MTPAARAIEIDAARPRARAGRARGVSPPLLAAALFASAVVLSPIVFTVARRSAKPRQRPQFI